MLKFVLFCGLISSCAFAASPYKQSLTQKSNKYASQGVFMGGQSGQAQALLRVRRASSTKVGLERVILDLGDQAGKVTSDTGFFQVAVDARNNRVVIELSQMLSSRVTEAELRRIFKSSSMVRSVDFTLDPQDSTGTIVLNLKRPVVAEAFRLTEPKKHSRLVVDLQAPKKL